MLLVKVSLSGVYDLSFTQLQGMCLESFLLWWYQLREGMRKFAQATCDIPTMYASDP